MQFIVANEQFAAALALVKGCIPTRSTIPILAHVVVEACADNQIAIRASNLDREAEATIAAEVQKPGGAALPGEVLAGLARRLSKGGQASVTLVDDRAKIVSGSAKYDLRMLPAADFPAAKEMSAQPVVFSMPAADLVKLITPTLAACDSKSARAYHQGVNVRIADKKLIAVGTDDKRIAIQSLDIPKGAASMPAVCIPVEAARLMLEVLADREGDAELAISPSLLELRLAGIRVASALVDCKLPEYGHLMPKTAPLVVLRPYALAEALERATVVFLGERDTNKRVPFVDLVIKPAGIELRAGIKGNEQAVELVEVEQASGEATMALNAQYLAECLAMWPESVAIGIAQDGARKPVLFSSAERPDMLCLQAPTAY